MQPQVQLEGPNPGDSDYAPPRLSPEREESWGMQSVPVGRRGMSRISQDYISQNTPRPPPPNGHARRNYRAMTALAQPSGSCSLLWEPRSLALRRGRRKNYKSQGVRHHRLRAGCTKEKLGGRPGPAARVLRGCGGRQRQLSGCKPVWPRALPRLPGASSSAA
uniref:uncharacterized protein C1orf159 homolog isoform X10 n=1 Tax=Callithrix jacchus TaxID=9483 RepID=UPI0023DD1A34|nr:uncharacterized protein C1orf159 homolog isoform X10 [Callithrix jacchus]